MNLPKNMIPLTREDESLIKEKMGKDHLITFDNGMNYIKCDENGKCPFLIDNGLCSIYGLRGSSCKSYPFFVDKYSGLSIDLHCPGVGKGWTDVVIIKKMIMELEKIHKIHFQSVYNNIEKNK